MIYKIKGVILEKDTNMIVVDTGGIAYEAACSLATYSSVGNIGDICELYTYMAVRENGIHQFLVLVLKWQ